MCNDPKCPLIREGIQHDAHDRIGDQDITDQCNDPRCTMNRTGIAHNRHDKYFKREKPKEAESEWQDDMQENHGQEQKSQQEYAEQEQKSHEIPDDEDDIMDKIFEEVLDELDRQSRQRQAGRSGRQSEVHGRHTNAAKKPQDTQQPRRSTNQVPAGNTILAATSPHDIFGIPKEATCRMIKSRYRDLAKAYDPSKGIINKSDIDKKVSNDIMTRINSAYLQLKTIHGCRK